MPSLGRGARRRRPSRGHVIKPTLFYLSLRGRRYVRFGRRWPLPFLPLRANRLLVGNMALKADHARFLGFRKELAFGLRNGKLVSIREVPSGAACSCVCPACDGALIAHKGPKIIHHFAHANATGGCGEGYGLETNAHLWAKLALGEALWIRLPPIVAEGGGLVRTVHRGKDFTFVAAALEKRAGEIVPDVELTAGDGRRLIVEVLVTHRCGPEKIARIEAGGVSAIEIDLAKWRNSGDAAAIAQALLTEAPRTWLYNPALAAASKELADVAAERAKAKAARQAAAAQREVSRIRRAAKRAAPELEHVHAELSRLGYGGALVGEQPGDGFIVHARLWKAAALGRLIERALGDRPLGQVTSDRLSDLIPDCLWRDDRHPRHRIDTQSLKAAVPGFTTPDDALHDFLHALQEENILHYHKGEYWLSPELVRRVREDREARRKAAEAALARSRRWLQTERQIDRLLSHPSASGLDAGFERKVWSSNFSFAPGRSLVSLTEAGDEDWKKLMSGLSDIERMLDGGPIAADLFDLPFERTRETARSQAEMIACEERAQAEAAEAEARSGRANAIRTEATLQLGAEAETWLAKTRTTDGASRVEVATESKEGLAFVRSGLNKRVADLEEARRRADLVEALQKRLRSATESAFGDPNHAAFFLGCKRDELGRQTPLEHCTDERGLQEALRLLPGSRRRR